MYAGQLSHRWREGLRQQRWDATERCWEYHREEMCAKKNIWEKCKQKRTLVIES